jgi:hypothetical protein
MSHAYTEEQLVEQPAIGLFEKKKGSNHSLDAIVKGSLNGSSFRVTSRQRAGRHLLATTLKFPGTNISDIRSYSSGCAAYPCVRSYAGHGKATR